MFISFSNASSISVVAALDSADFLIGCAFILEEFRKFVNYFLWLHGGMPFPVNKERPFWTKQSMKAIRGLMLAGFTLKPKDANTAGAVGGEVRR